MTDLHTHILPGMDDGAKTPEESLQMLRMERDQGVDTVVLTPHFYRDRERPEWFLARRRASAEALRQEAEALRGPAAEYQSLKEHVADIEISAHRRTEEFRAKAMERLAQCIAQQRAWCSQRRSTYLSMNVSLLEQLRQAEQAVENADYTAFDSMISELQRLEDELKQPDAQA